MLQFKEVRYDCERIWDFIKAEWRFAWRPRRRPPVINPVIDTDDSEDDSDDSDDTFDDSDDTADDSDDTPDDPEDTSDSQRDSDDSGYHSSEDEKEIEAEIIRPNSRNATYYEPLWQTILNRRNPHPYGPQYTSLLNHDQPTEEDLNHIDGHPTRPAEEPQSRYSLNNGLRFLKRCFLRQLLRSPFKHYDEANFPSDSEFPRRNAVNPFFETRYERVSRQRRRRSRNNYVEIIEKDCQIAIKADTDDDTSNETNNDNDNDKENAALPCGAVPFLESPRVLKPGSSMDPPARKHPLLR